MAGRVLQWYLLPRFTPALKGTITVLGVVGFSLVVPALLWSLVLGGPLFVAVALAVIGAVCLYLCFGLLFYGPEYVAVDPRGFMLVHAKRSGRGETTSVAWDQVLAAYRQTRTNYGPSGSPGRRWYLEVGLDYDLRGNRRKATLLLTDWQARVLLARPEMAKFQVPPAFLDQLRGDTDKGPGAQPVPAPALELSEDPFPLRPNEYADASVSYRDVP